MDDVIRPGDLFKADPKSRGPKDIEEFVAKRKVVVEEGAPDTSDKSIKPLIKTELGRAKTAGEFREDAYALECAMSVLERKRMKKKKDRKRQRKEIKNAIAIIARVAAKYRSLANELEQDSA